MTHPSDKSGKGPRMPRTDKDETKDKRRSPRTNERKDTDAGDRRDRRTDRTHDRDRYRDQRPDRERTPQRDRQTDRTNDRDRRPSDRPSDRDRRPSDRQSDRYRDQRPDRERTPQRDRQTDRTHDSDKDRDRRPSDRPSDRYRDRNKPRPEQKQKAPGPDPNTEGYRLNKFIAHAGLCSRREAAEWIKAGKISVNGVKVTNPAVTVTDSDTVTCNGQKVSIEERKVYLLMNKPKDTITTLSDDRGRRTVMDIIAQKVRERVYPVGRLDRNTTGLLLLTNDGDLAKKLTHPSHEVKKIYHAFLDKDMSDKDLETLKAGIELEDGFIKPDKLDRVKDSGQHEIGVEIHSGRNRIVRRMFEALGYKVIKLDRVYFAGLTKKDLPRGRFRHLNDREIIMLKHFT